MTHRALFPSGGLFSVLKRGVFPLLLILLCGCAKEEPKSFSALLEEQRKALVGTDYGEGFDRSMAVLDELATQKQDPEVGIAAILLRSQAHLDLMIGALLTEEPALYEKLKSRLSWRLERSLTDPRNFQLLAQDLLESFRMVARESADKPEVRRTAEALALFADGMQGILFRNKIRYFEGCAAVAALPQLRYLHDLMAVRDLVHECASRVGAPAGNWQNIALTVVARVCSGAATRYLADLCSTPAALADPAKDDYCTTDFGVLPESMRKMAGQRLGAECRAPGTADGNASGKADGNANGAASGMADGNANAVGGGAGEAAVRAYYAATFDRLEKDADQLPVPTRDVVRRLSEGREASLKGVHMLFSGTIE